MLSRARALETARRHLRDVKSRGTRQDRLHKRSISSVSASVCLVSGVGRLQHRGGYVAALMFGCRMRERRYGGARIAGFAFLVDWQLIDDLRIGDRVSAAVMCGVYQNRGDDVKIRDVLWEISHYLPVEAESSGSPPKPEAFQPYAMPKRKTHAEIGCAPLRRGNRIVV